MATLCYGSLHCGEEITFVEYVYLHVFSATLIDGGDDDGDGVHGDEYDGINSYMVFDVGT